jgi:hypothetical protein
MGLLDFFMGIQEPVVAVFFVTKCTPLPENSAYGSCDMVGEVTGPGIAGVVVEHNSPFTSRDKWPKPGDTLPVLADRGNPTFLKIQWKDVQPHE